MQRARRTGLISITLMALCYGSSAEAQEPLPPCAPRGAPAGAVQASLQLTTVNGRPTTGPIELTFGDRRDEREFIIEHQVHDCVFSESEVGSEVEALHRRPAGSDGKVLSADIELTTTIQNPSLAVSVFRINPSDERSMPGKFLTGFVVTDSRFSHFQQDINVSLRYHRTWLLFITLLIPALVIGPLVIWAKGRAGGSTESFWAWWGKIMNVAGIFVGVAAARAYFGSRVLGSPDYGGDLFDRFPIAWVLSEEWYLVAAGTLSAFVTAALATSLVGDAARGGTDKESRANSEGGRFARS
jgi:hypothetical protein